MNMDIWKTIFLYNVGGIRKFKVFIFAGIGSSICLFHHCLGVELLLAFHLKLPGLAATAVLRSCCVGG